MNKIQIGIACAPKCAKYVEFLIGTIEKTVSGNNEIGFLIGISDAGKSYQEADRKYIDNIKSKYSCEIFDIAPKNVIGSPGGISHGKALNALLKQMDSEYGMFIDCDIAMLAKDWDVKMKDRIKDKTVIIGSEYDGDKKYKNFPNATFCMFKTNILKDLQMSFAPKGSIVIDSHNADVFSRNIGDSIILDVGWELPYKLKKNGYDGFTMPVRSRKDSRSLFVGELRAVEFQLNGEVIATHVGRSFSRDFMTNQIVIDWRKKVEEWVK